MQMKLRRIFLLRLLFFSSLEPKIRQLSRPIFSLLFRLFRLLTLFFENCSLTENVSLEMLNGNSRLDLLNVSLPLDSLSLAFSRSNAYHRNQIPNILLFQCDQFFEQSCNEARLTLSG